MYKKFIKLFHKCFKKKSSYFHVIFKMDWKPLFLIFHDIYEVQRLINDSINTKFGNCESICTPFVYCYILGGQI
jgi:hypothetical protein